MLTTLRSALSLMLLLSTTLLQARPDDPARFGRWEKSIQGIETWDREVPPPQGAIVFAGSSSIVYWDLHRAFPDLQTINRGFGGSKIADSTHFADRIIIPVLPREIVFYAGDNDISVGSPPETVANDFREFVETIHKALPKTKITFLAIKPSIARKKQEPLQRKANALIAAYCRTDARLRYVDTASPMIGNDGLPRSDYLRKDGLHLSDKGYDVWNAILKPILK